MAHLKKVNKKQRMESTTNQPDSCFHSLNTSSFTARYKLRVLISLPKLHIYAYCGWWKQYTVHLVVLRINLVIDFTLWLCSSGTTNVSSCLPPPTYQITF